MLFSKHVRVVAIKYRHRKVYVTKPGCEQNRKERDKKRPTGTRKRTLEGVPRLPTPAKARMWLAIPKVRGKTSRSSSIGPERTQTKINTNAQQQTGKWQKECFKVCWKEVI